MNFVTKDVFLATKNISSLIFVTKSTFCCSLWRQTIIFMHSHCWLWVFSFLKFYEPPNLVSAIHWVWAKQAKCQNQFHFLYYIIAFQFWITSIKDGSFSPAPEDPINQNDLFWQSLNLCRLSSTSYLQHESPKSKHISVSGCPSCFSMLWSQITHCSTLQKSLLFSTVKPSKKVLETVEESIS